MLRKLLFAILFLQISCLSDAIESENYLNPWKFSEIRSNKEAYIVFNEISKNKTMPAWVFNKDIMIKEQSAHLIKFDGYTAYVMSACSFSTCDREKLAIMYIPKTKEMYGVLLISISKSKENITWLGLHKSKKPDIAKTILFSALTTTFQNYYWKFSFE